VDPQVPEIDVDTLAQQRDVPLVDVREVDEYHEFHVPGAQLIPLSEFTERVDEVPADGQVFIICRSGARSRQAAEYLRERGVDAVNVAGGSLAWVDAGHEVATGAEPG
jgi:rhodanese-related sulfurtransferase